jgi:hypothetical protein
VTREDGVATLASTRCHRCRGAEGRRFRFYYGHVRREWPELRPRYDIAGESETWLCDRCLHEGRGIAWAYMAVVAAVMCVLTPLGTAAAGVAGGYWRAGYTLDPPLPLVVAGCLVMAVAMPALLVRVALTRPLTRRRAEHINLMRHARKAMRARGITAILTPDQYARFQTQDRVRQVVGEM